ncbi:MAG: FecR domain-containing protein [Mangrovibacterium sp.]|nr:FecR domain-containing protein [Mangrovibacterium sp.]
MKGFFRKYLDNRCTEEEFRSFLDLFMKPGNRQVLEEDMKEDWKRETGGATPDLSETLYRIHYEINRQEQQQPKVRRLVTFMTRIAAILLLPLSIAYFLQLQKDTGEQEVLQTISTPLASKTSFELPDGSKVWLNSGSSLRFPKAFDGKTRLVQLTGEAYFDVKKGERPFQVETAHVTVAVLGTAFNVMAYGHELPAVTLERGKVLLETRSKKHEFLVPGQQAVIDTLNQSITMRMVETNLYSSWIRDQLIFKNETLASVVNRLERWYNIRIVVTDPDLLGIPMTATIGYESIREVMELMDMTLPIKYRYNKEERELVISSIKKNGMPMP